MARKRKKVGDPVPVEPLPPPPDPIPAPCSCCFDCTGKAKGTMFFCDGNGGCTAIAPPNVDSVLKFNNTNKIPYWNPE